MNKKLSTVLIAAALLALAVPAFAQNSGPRTGGGQGQVGRQGGPGGGQGGRMMMGRMGEQMVEKALTKAGASADQKAKVKALNEKNAKARTTFMEKELKIKMPTPPKAGAAAGARPPRPEMTDAQRTKMREFSQKQMTATTAEMKKILGAKYDAFTKALQAEMQAMRGQMGGGRPGQGGGAGAGKGAGKKPPTK
jgi:hypothetical protein